MRTVVLGDGLLGSEIVKQTNWDYVSRKKDNFEISDRSFIKSPILGSKGVTLINCIAHTDTYSNERSIHWNVNVVGIKNLLDYCEKWECKLVHISTDYLYSNSKPNATENDVPVHCENWYGYTKLVADALVQLYNPNHLIIRETHKPTPFPYKQAWVDQIGNFDYVDKITSLIVMLVENKCKGIYNVGTETKSMFDLAKQTCNEVEEIYKPYYAPLNTTMNLAKLRDVIKRIDK